MLRQAALAQRRMEGAAPVEASGESTSLSDDALKAMLIQKMIRVEHDDQSTAQLIEALKPLPLEALERIARYGTRLEVYDKSSPDLPLYANHLRKPNLAGAYSPTANVVFVDKDNVTGRILVHEAIHALDMSLGQPSAQSPWTVARDQARQSRQAIRPYATHNSAEYFADNLAASLFSKAAMTELLANDWAGGVGIVGLDKDQYALEHTHYHQEGQTEADPIGAKLCKKFWEVLPKYGEVAPRPALSAQEYREHMLEQLRRKKAAEASRG